MLDIYAALAEQEHRMISNRTKDALKAAKASLRISELIDLRCDQIDFEAAFSWRERVAEFGETVIAATIHS
jgi:hypothetical protein